MFVSYCDLSITIELDPTIPEGGRVRFIALQDISKGDYVVVDDYTGFLRPGTLKDFTDL